MRGMGEDSWHEKNDNLYCDADMKTACEKDVTE